MGVVVTTSLLMREVKGSITWPIKSDTVLPMACHRCDVSSVLPRRSRGDGPMGPTNSLCVSAYYREYNKDLIFLCFLIRTDCE